MTFFDPSLGMSINPSESDRYQKLGLALKRKGDFRQAQQAYNKAIRLNPTDQMAYYGLAKTYHLGGEINKAIICYITTSHLIIRSMRIALKQPEANAVKDMRRFSELDASPDALGYLRQSHPDGDLILLDTNTPRHLAHVIIDYNEEHTRPEVIINHLNIYYQNLSGNDASQLDMDIELQFYLPVGRVFLLENLQWDSIDDIRAFRYYKGASNFSFLSAQYLWESYWQ